MIDLVKKTAPDSSCKTKLFFTDIDGTLLDDEKNITVEVQAAIDKAINAGHKIILSSGRATSSTLTIASRLGLDIPGCYIVAYNGATIYECSTGKLLLNRTLPFDLVDFIEQATKEAGIYSETFQDQLVITDTPGPEFDRYRKSSTMKGFVVDRYVDYLTKEPNKMLLIDLNTQQRILALMDKIRPSVGNRIDSMFSSPIYYEIVPKGVSKGSAVQFLADYLHVPMENTVAAGDSENDISMIRSAHIGVAMQNAMQCAKDAADYVTEKDNNHSGFAEIIYKFIL